MRFIGLLLNDFYRKNLEIISKNISYFRISCISWSLGAAVGSILGGILVEQNLLLALSIVTLVIFGLLIVVFMMKNRFPNFASLEAGLDLKESIIGHLVFIFRISRFMAFLLQDKILINIKMLILNIILTSFLIILYPFFSN